MCGVSAESGFQVKIKKTRDAQPARRPARQNDGLKGIQRHCQAADHSGNKSNNMHRHVLQEMQRAATYRSIHHHIDSNYDDYARNFCERTRLWKSSEARKISQQIYAT